MNSGGQNQWNVIAIHEMFKFYQQTGKLHTNDDLKNSSVANRTTRSDSRIPSDTNERPGEAPSFWQESTLGHLMGGALHVVRSWRGDQLAADVEEY